VAKKTAKSKTKIKLNDLVASRVQHYRKLRKLNQDELANLSGLSRNTVYNYEAGKGFTSEGLVRIAEALKIDESDLVTVDEPSDPVVIELTLAEMLEKSLNLVKQQERQSSKIPEEILGLLEKVNNYHFLKDFLTSLVESNNKK
jgi:transcriptional regulator with XRE-family HTH domain